MIKKLLLVAALAIASVSAMAQGMRGGFAAMMNAPAGLMRRDDVKAELQLTDDQKNKLAEISSDTRAKMSQAAQDSGDDQEARMKAITEIMTQVNDQVIKLLTPDQQKRLKEIQYQIGGYRMIVSDKDLQTQLAITEDERTKIVNISKTADAANASVGEKMRNQEIQFPEVRAAFQRNNDALNSGIEAILTADQKAKFKTLQGKTFVQTSQPGFGGRGGK